MFPICSVIRAEIHAEHDRLSGGACHPLFVCDCIAVEHEATESRCFERLPFSIRQPDSCFAAPFADEKGKSRERWRRVKVGLAKFLVDLLHGIVLRDGCGWLRAAHGAAVRHRRPSVFHTGAPRVAFSRPTRSLSADPIGRPSAGLRRCRMPCGISSGYIDGAAFTAGCWRKSRCLCSPRSSGPGSRARQRSGWRGCRSGRETWCHN
jgi:hypothetical protein